jgi:hypothetical protein
MQATKFVRKNSAGGYHSSAFSISPRCFVHDDAMIAWLRNGFAAGEVK